MQCRFKSYSESKESENYDKTQSKLNALNSSSTPNDDRRQSINTMLASNFKIKRFNTLRA